jgi:hypothetical protein
VRAAGVLAMGLMFDMPGVDDVATVRRVAMFKHLAHVVVTVLCRVEVKIRTSVVLSDSLMGHAANGLVSSVAGESVRLVPRAPQTFQRSGSPVAWTRILLRRPVAQTHYFRVTRCVARKRT